MRLALNQGTLFLELGKGLLLVLKSDLLHARNFAFLAFDLVSQHKNQFLDRLAGF
jgi:hypothetical protein